MTCEFEGNTIYDKAAYRALVHVMVNRVRRTPRILLLSAGVLMLFSGFVLLFLKKALALGGCLMLLAGDCRMDGGDLFGTVSHKNADEGAKTEPT